jgi:hypothetical protein
MKTIRRTLVITGMLFVWGTQGCDRPEETTPSPAKSTPKAAAAVLPDTLWAKAAPSGARGVAEIKADATATGEVVVKGRLGGRVDPFVQGAAVFLLTDLKVKHCGELHGDACKTPWDYCCEPKESLAASRATIQIVDANGKPFLVNLKGQHGLDPLAILTIAGDVTSRDAGGTIVINARSIYVHPET